MFDSAQSLPHTGLTIANHWQSASSLIANRARQDRQRGGLCRVGLSNERGRQSMARIPVVEDSNANTKQGSGTAAIAVIALTAMAMKEDRAKSRPAGDNGCITKTLRYQKPCEEVDAPAFKTEPHRP
jgi:hypothetical protein